MDLDAYIARRFREHGLRFYHAENLEDFRTYCAAQALLSREELKRHNPNGHTLFYSDASDQNLGVLNRVFGNLSDFGWLYSNRPRTIPNVYGPIQLVFRPDAFSLMRDIRITQQSIVKLGLSWRYQSLSTADAIELLLRTERPRQQLNPAFYSCELSCGNTSLPFAFLERVVVEPIVVSGRRLHEWVEAALHAYGLRALVEVRPYEDLAKLGALQQLVSTCEGLQLSATQDEWLMDSSILPAAFQHLSLEKRTRLLLWCRYFTYGTVLPSRGSSIRPGA